MGNKKAEKAQITRESFLRIIRDKEYTIERLGKVREIDRGAKTIQRCLSDGWMPFDLLDRIGRFLDVDPEYLSGAYDRRFEEIKDTLPDPELTRYLWTRTDRFPYSKHETQALDYAAYILDTLRINDISKDQFLALPPEKRRALQFDIGAALHSVIQRYFSEDCNGLSTDMGLTTEGLTLLMGEWING